MTKPRLGVILREPFQPGDSTHRVLQSMDHVLIHAMFGGKRNNKYPVGNLFEIESYLEKFPPSVKSFSVFVPPAQRTPSFLAGLVEDFLKFMSIESIFVELNPLFNGEFESTHQFVTNLLALRHEMRVGIVSSSYSWNEQEFSLLAGLGEASQIFPCPLVDHLEQASLLPQNSVPIIFSMPEKERANFSESVNGTVFSEFVFWRPGLFDGIEIKEMPIRQTQSNGKEGMPFQALYPSAKRESPSLASKVKGNLMPGTTYQITEIRNGSMGERFGKLQDGFWVVISQGQETYLKELLS